MKFADIFFGNNVEIDASTSLRNMDAYSSLMLLNGLLLEKW